MDCHNNKKNIYNNLGDPLTFPLAPKEDTIISLSDTLVYDQIPALAVLVFILGTLT